MFSRDAENSSRGIVAPSANATDEFVADRAFSRRGGRLEMERWRDGEVEERWVGVPRSAPRRG